MSTYEIMRHFADSWGLLLLTIVFLFVVAFVFRAGSRAQYDNAARIPLEDDSKA
jgi:cytochrome c oxidase cbb3-type subunit IV